MPRWRSILPSACRSNTAGADVKGKINGFAALDIHPYRRYVVTKAAAGQACCRHILILLYSHLKWTLHRIWD